MKKKPVVLAVSGVKNSGKTTLIQRVLPLLTQAGLQVAVIKHDGHGFQPDDPNTDTGRYLTAGAAATALFDGKAFRIVEQKTVDEHILIQHFSWADLILLEGFKYSQWPKLEIVRKDNSSVSVCDPTTLVALVTDTDLSIPHVSSIHLDDIEGIAEAIMSFLKQDTNYHSIQ